MDGKTNQPGDVRENLSARNHVGAGLRLAETIASEQIAAQQAIATTHPATLTPAQMWDIAEAKLTSIDLDTGPEALIVRSEDELYQVVRAILAASGGAHAVPEGCKDCIGTYFLLGEVCRHCGHVAEGQGFKSTAPTTQDQGEGK